MVATSEYIVALGENRWQFAIADYAFVFLLMTIDRQYQKLVDAPESQGEIVTSGKLPQDFETRISRLCLPKDMVDDANSIIADWPALALQRNNLAHAWAYSDPVTKKSQLGGYCHRIPKKGQPEHTMMNWSVADLRRMTADLRAISARIKSWRISFQKSGIAPLS